MSFKFNPLIFSGFDIAGSSAYNGYKGPVSIVGDLPTTGNNAGDMRVTLDTDEAWVWDGDGNRWVNVGLREAVGIGNTPNPQGHNLILDNSNPGITLRELLLQPANAANPGIITTDAQEFSGDKTFSGNIIMNNTDILEPTNIRRTQPGDITIENQDGSVNFLMPSGDLNVQALNSSQSYSGSNNIQADSIQIRAQSNLGIDSQNNALISASNAMGVSGGQLSFSSSNGFIDMGVSRLSNLVDATDPQDAVTLAQADATYIPLTEKGQPNGVAELDGAGKVPIQQLPASIMTYEGVWDASTNTPTLADGVGDGGEVYRVGTAGTQDLGSGPIDFQVGDYAILNSSLIWEKSDTTDAVASVNGLIGNVVLDADDVGAANQQLSNLVGPTALSVDLVPAADGSASLGSPTNRFGSISGQALGIDSIYNSTQGGPGGQVDVFTTLDMNGQQVISLLDPVNPQDAATKAYVDAATPTGPANTIAYYDAAGNLSAFGSTANNSVSWGFANSTILANGNGSFARGASFNGGILNSSGRASTAFGFAEDGGTLRAGPSEAAFASGRAGDGATILANGTGAFAQGFATGSGSLLQVTGEGSNAFGLVVGGGELKTSGSGSLIGGLVIGAGESSASTADASVTFGLGHNNNSFISLVAGRFSDINGSPTTWVDTDPLLALGNGTSLADLNNAFLVLKDGTQFIKDPSLAGATAGYVRTLIDAVTGEVGWADVSVTPAGANGQIQFNDGGVFGANSLLSRSATGEVTILTTSGAGANLTLSDDGNNTDPKYIRFRDGNYAQSDGYLINTGVNAAGPFSGQGQFEFILGTATTHPTYGKTAWYTADQRIFSVSGGGAPVLSFQKDINLDSQNQLRFRDADNSNSVGFLAPAVVATDVTWTLPDTDGAAGTTLTTDGAGQLSWSAGGATNKKELFTLSAGDITNGYIDLLNVAKTDSIDFLVKGGGIQIEGIGQDYTVSYTGGAGGKTRITWAGIGLIANDVIVVKYQY